MKPSHVAGLLVDGWLGELPQNRRARESLRQLSVRLESQLGPETWSRIRREPETHRGLLAESLEQLERRDPIVVSLTDDLDSYGASCRDFRRPRQRSYPIGILRAEPLERPRPQPPAPAGEASLLIRILFLGASPDPERPVRIDKELWEIREALWRGSHRHRFDLRSEMAVPVEALQRMLQDHRPTILHFGGHGQGEELLFEGPAGGRVVSAKALGDLISLFSAVRCVVLNACYTASQAARLAEALGGAVIGMERAIGDPAAIAFAGAFYGHLAYGTPVEGAFHLARNQLDLLGLTATDMPQLYGPPEARTACFAEQT